MVHLPTLTINMGFGFKVFYVQCQDFKFTQVCNDHVVFAYLTFPGLTRSFTGLPVHQKVLESVAHKREAIEVVQIILYSPISSSWFDILGKALDVQASSRCLLPSYFGLDFFQQCLNSPVKPDWPTKPFCSHGVKFDNLMMMWWKIRRWTKTKSSWLWSSFDHYLPTWLHCWCLFFVVLQSHPLTSWNIWKFLHWISGSRHQCSGLKRLRKKITMGTDSTVLWMWSMNMAFFGWRNLLVNMALFGFLTNQSKRHTLKVCVSHSFSKCGILTPWSAALSE